MTLLDLIRLGDDDYMLMCREISTQSPCTRTRVGAVLVSDEHVRVASCGNMICQSMGCLREKAKSGEDLDNCLGAHAEQKVIIDAGILECHGATMYVTHFPCAACARMIVYSGIRRVVYDKNWGNMSLSKMILDTGYVTYHKYSKEMS